MRFLIYAPRYDSSSGGICVLYSLCDDLVRMGYNASIVVWGNGCIVNDSDIVIYPEVVNGNPLNAGKVVRYLLHREGEISGMNMNSGDGDFILSWSKLYHGSAHGYLRKVNISNYFNDIGTRCSMDRSIDCTYIGKGGLYTNCSIVRGTMHIDRGNPISKVALADLLRVTRFLYTYDVVSSIVDEAILCGAIVVPLLWKPFSRDEIGDSELRFPYVRISDVGKVSDEYYISRDLHVKNICQDRVGYLSRLKDVADGIAGYFGI